MPNFCYIWWFFKVERSEGIQNFKKSSNMATKRRKALFNLPYTHFLADSGSPKIGFWFARSATKFTAGQKNSCSQINQFHEKIFWPNSIFGDFKNGQKSIFELGKRLKVPEMQFHEQNLFLFIWFHKFFCLEIFKFSGLLLFIHLLP